MKIDDGEGYFKYFPFILEFFAVASCSFFFSICCRLSFGGGGMGKSVAKWSIKSF